MSCVVFTLLFAVSTVERTVGQHQLSYPGSVVSAL